jgi:hypothetical protein
MQNGQVGKQDLHKLALEYKLKYIPDYLQYKIGIRILTRYAWVFITCLLCAFPVSSMLSVYVVLKLEIKLSFVKATEIQSVFLILSLWQNRENKLSVELLNNFFHSLSCPYD